MEVAYGGHNCGYLWINNRDTHHQEIVHDTDRLQNKTSGKITSIIKLFSWYRHKTNFPVGKTTIMGERVKDFV